MSLRARLARDANGLFAATFLARAIDLALYLSLARALGVEAFGRYAYALSFTLLFNVLGDLGLSTVLTREVGRTPERAGELMRSCLWIKLALAAVTLTAVIAASRLDPAAPQTLPLVGPIVVGMLLNSGSLLFEGLLRSNGRSGRNGAGLVLQSAVALVAGIGLLQQGIGPRAGALAFLCGALARMASAVWWSRDLWSMAPSRRRTWGDQAALMRESAPLALATVFLAGYFRVDTVVLRAFQGEHAVGLYAGIFRIFEAFALMAVASRSFLFPVAARATDGPPEALGVLCRRTLRFQLLFTLGVAVVVSSQAPAVVSGVLGPAYAAAGTTLGILIWALPGSYMADTLLLLLTARYNPTLGAWALGIAAGWNVALNLALAPRLSLTGSAIATVVSEWTCFAILLVMFRRAVPVPRLSAVIWRPVVASLLLGALLAAGSWWSPRGPGSVPLILAAAVPAYLLLLMGTGALRRDDFQRLRGALSGTRR